MESNIAYVAESADLKNGAKDLAQRSVEMAKIILKQHLSHEQITKPGRKAQHLTVDRKSGEITDKN